jgi:ribosomal protein S18 acetylase RimI-like enzyme
MLDTYPKITERAALLAATADHPFVRYSTRAGGGDAFAGRSATVWHGGTSQSSMVGALGDGAAALAVVTALRADGAIAPGARAELPRMRHAIIEAAFPGVSIVDWDLRWLCSLPPVIAGEADVVALTDADSDEINAILDAGLPDAHVRPGAGRVRGWYGIRDGADLVAVAADSSSFGIGFLNSIAVRPESQGRQLGSAVTLWLARRLRAETDTVLLGVWMHNVHASRLYHRLGFTGLHEITAFTLP